MQNLKKEEEKNTIKDTYTKPFLFFMVPPFLCLCLSPLPFFFLSTYHGTFYFLFNVPWDSHRPKTDPHRCLRALPHDLALSSTSCKLQDPCIMFCLKLGKSVSPPHGPSGIMAKVGEVSLSIPQALPCSG